MPCEEQGGTFQHGMFGGFWGHCKWQEETRQQETSGLSGQSLTQWTCYVRTMLKKGADKYAATMLINRMMPKSSTILLQWLPITERYTSRRGMKRHPPHPPHKCSQAKSRLWESFQLDRSGCGCSKVRLAPQAPKAISNPPTQQHGRGGVAITAQNGSNSEWEGLLTWHIAVLTYYPPLATLLPLPDQPQLSALSRTALLQPPLLHRPVPGPGAAAECRPGRHSLPQAPAVHHRGQCCSPCSSLSAGLTGF